MPDIDINPAALSRPATSLATPTLTTRTLTLSGTGQKPAKASQIIPSRIDLEPLYAALKAAVTPEQWVIYKNTVSEFFCGMSILHFTLPTMPNSYTHHDLQAALIKQSTGSVLTPSSTVLPGKSSIYTINYLLLYMAILLERCLTRARRPGSVPMTSLSHLLAASLLLAMQRNED